MYARRRLGLDCNSSFPLHFEFIQDLLILARLFQLYCLGELCDV